MGRRWRCEYAERYPQNVEALVLDSVVAPDKNDPFALSTFRAMKPVFEELCSARACAGITNNPLGDLARLAARLRKHALNGFVYDGSGKRHRTTMSDVGFLNLIAAGDLNPALRALLPASTQSALRGDPAPLLRLNLLSEGLVPNLPGTPTAAARAAADVRPAPRPPGSAAAGAWGRGIPSVPAADASSDGIDEALFVDTTCEEAAFPWQRSAAPGTRVAEAMGALRALPASDFYPFDASVEWADSVLPGCAQWPNLAPPPPAIAPLPNVPTLILSGAQDLRTPTAGAEALAGRIPGSQLEVVPYTGHSVIGSDFSGCAQAALKAFFTTGAAPPCRASRDPFAPTPITPTKLAFVKPVGGVKGRAGSTLAVALDTIVDLERQVIGATLQAAQALPSGSSFGGLRGGYARISSSALRLHRLSLVAGVQLSGTFTIVKGRLRPANLRVEGSLAARGTVRIGAPVVSGTLGGRRFSVNIAKVRLARAAAAARASHGPSLSEPALAVYAERTSPERAARGRAGVAALSRIHPRGTALGASTLSGMTNALASESSPYLRQHANNPVDWLPWGPKALERARERDVPLLVSIGYSACHWCHVMERESFEDERTARLMNEGFVCVKVDREERPDVDALYMEAVQGMTGHGGWPLNVFLTPEGLPFYGGTYFPPQERPGTPSFAQVLLSVSEAWRERGEEIRASGEQLRERLSGGALLRPTAEPFDETSLDAAVERLRASFDAVHGGFGGAPKFPQASVLEFLMCRGADPREHAQPIPSNPPSTSPTPKTTAATSAPARMALYTLRSMAGGGIHDQVGGGFHRYAVDDTWTVPHFEKMLYDNALLARAYLHGAQLSGDGELLRVCGDTLELGAARDERPRGRLLRGARRRLRGRRGALLRVERHRARERAGRGRRRGDPLAGRHRGGQLRRRVGRESALRARPERAGGSRPASRRRDAPANSRAVARRARDAHEAGTRRQAPHELERADDLGAGRGGRPPAGCRPSPPLPATAGRPRRAHGVARRARPRRSSPRPLSARSSYCATCAIPDGRLLRTYSNGEAKIAAYLEDHAFLLEALLALFEATCEERWLSTREGARGRADRALLRPDRRRLLLDGDGRRSADRAAQGARGLPHPGRRVERGDGLAAARSAHRRDGVRAPEPGAIDLLKTIAPRHPTSFGHMLQAMHWHLSPMRPIACAIPASRAGPAVARQWPLLSDFSSDRLTELEGAEIVTGWFQRSKEIVPLSEPLFEIWSG